MNISVENFKCFEKNSFFFTENLNLIFGKSGSGKSTIFNSIIFGLSGSEKINIKSYNKKKCKVIINIDNIHIERTQTPNRLIVSKDNEKYEDDFAEQVISNSINLDILKIDGLSSLKNIENFIFFGIESYISLDNKIKSSLKISNKIIKELNIKTQVIKPMVENFKINDQYSGDIDNVNFQDEYQKNIEIIEKYKTELINTKTEMEQYYIYRLLYQDLTGVEFLIFQDYNNETLVGDFELKLSEYFKFTEARKKIKKIKLKMEQINNYNFVFDEKTCEIIISNIEKFKKFKFYEKKKLDNITKNESDSIIYTCPKCKISCYLINKKLTTTDYFIEQNNFRILKEYFNNFKFTSILNDNYDDIDYFYKTINDNYTTYKDNRIKYSMFEQQIKELENLFPENYLGFVEHNVEEKYSKFKNIMTIYEKIQKISYPKNDIHKYFNSLVDSLNLKIRYKYDKLFYGDEYIIEDDFFIIESLLSTIKKKIIKNIYENQPNEPDEQYIEELEQKINNKKAENSGIIRIMEEFNKRQIYKIEESAYFKNLNILKDMEFNLKKENDNIKTLSDLKLLNDESVLLYLHNMIDIINNTINEIISEFFPEKNIKLFLDIYQEKKLNCEYKITHKIFFNDNLCDYKNLSSGEKSRIDLSCKLSFCKILDFFSSNKKINILLLDEKTLNIEKDLEFDIFCLIKKLFPKNWFIICSTHDTIDGVFDNIVSL